MIIRGYILYRSTGPDKKPVTFWAIRSKQIINSTTFKVIIGLGWAQGGRGWVPEATLRPNMYVFGYFWGLITFRSTYISIVTCQHPVGGTRGYRVDVFCINYEWYTYQSLPSGSPIQHTVFGLHVTMFGALVCVLEGGEIIKNKIDAMIGASI